MLSGKILSPAEFMPFLTRSGTHCLLRFDSEIEAKFGVKFLERVLTPKGLGSVVGVDDGGYLFFFLDRDNALASWSHIHTNLYAYEGFTPSSTDQPEQLIRHLESIGICRSLDVLHELFSEHNLSVFNDSIEALTKLKE